MPYTINAFTGNFDFYTDVASSGAVVEFTTDDGNTVTPNGAGNVQLDGITVANGTNATPLFTDGGTANTVRFELQVGTAIAAAPADFNDAGIVSLDSSQFTVDPNGFVQLSGSTIEEVNIDFNSAPGTDPIVPTGGVITIQGNTVANATNLNSPVATHSRAANTFNVEVQLSTALGAAPGDNFDAGLSSFSNSFFSVDSNGFVQIIGDLAALEALGGVGFPTRIAADTWIQRTFAGAPDGSIAVTNGNGVSGAPTISLNDRVRNQGVYFENIGCSYAAGTGTFTIHSADGSAFSSSNPGIVVLPSKATPGTFTTYSITSNQAFIDDNGASEIIGNLFGFTTAVAITVNVPFFIYAVSNDNEDTIQFMLSRYPHRQISAATIGTPSSAIADAEGDFFSFDNITTTEWDQNPAVCVGSINMQMSALDDWTVQTLSTQTGIAQYQENVFFTQPPGQFGANSGTVTVANGGTAPAFSTNNTDYTISKNGYVYYRVFLNGDAGTDGAGAVNALITAPFQVEDTANQQTLGPGILGLPATDEFIFALGTTNNTLLIRRNSGATPFATWSLFTNGNRTISFDIYYHISQ